MAASLAPYYITASSLSLAASLFVIVCYLKFKELRSHPSSVILWRSCYDLIFSLQLIVQFSLARDVVSANCDVFAFLFQFSVLGSQTWYFLISVDLWRNLRNPFSDPNSHLPTYHMAVHLTSAITSVILVAAQATQYRPNMEICWIKITTAAKDPNPYNWVLFFAPTILYYFYSLGVMIYAGYRLRTGLRQTFALRLKILWNSARYVGAFCIYWTLAGVIYLFIYNDQISSEGQESGDDRDTALYAAFAITLAIRGVIDVAVWTYNQGVYEVIHAWWYREGVSKEAAATDINRALRREVLILTTNGICQSIDAAEATPYEDLPPTASHYPTSLSQHEVVAPMATKHISLHLKDSEEKREQQKGIVDRPMPPVPFIDYAPQVFRYLRKKFRISPAQYKQSILGNTEAMIEKYTEGRSGSFFYFSEDGDFIVKTLTSGEARFFLRFLPNYTTYMSQNPHSLICKFVGFHSIQLYSQTIYLVVMQSVFLTKRAIHERYDLKGSWVDRHSKNPDPSKGVLKDSDLKRRLHLTEADRQQFLEQITLDANFLRDNGIMDYSLLLGIHNTFQQVIEGPGLYFVGVIDILQEWNLKKKAERFLKITFRCKDPDGLSAVPPDAYAWRFIRAMSNITQPFNGAGMVDGITAALLKSLPGSSLEASAAGVLAGVGVSQLHLQPAGAGAGAEATHPQDVLITVADADTQPQEAKAEEMAPLSTAAPPSENE